MCMTGTSDTACCQIAATLQDQLGADCAGVWESGNEETGRIIRVVCGDARLKGLITLGSVNTVAVMIVAYS